MESLKKVKVRFAPSPTGSLHIGSVRTAFFNYLFAKSQKGEFILRIEDTDQKRFVQGAEEEILETLNWLTLEYSGEIVHQSERLKIYKEHADLLIDKKIAFEKDGAVWVKVPEDKKLEWVDLVGNKKISFLGKDVDEFVILKSDGFPTYHLANVVDDHLMGITHVLRGEEWTTSTPKHLYLYECFGWEAPFFAHLPIILGADKSKLSKRHGAKSALDYRSDGYIKEGLLNFLALLGWNPGGDKEQMSLEEMISLFKIEDVNTANSIFDVKKLEWLNSVWIRSLESKDLENRLKDFYPKNNEVTKLLDSSSSNIIIKAAASRMRVLGDFEKLVDIKKERTFANEEKEIAKSLLEFLVNDLGDSDWQDEKFLAALKNFSKEKNVPFKIIYFLLSGKEQGIGLLELNQIYKKDFFVNNLNSE